MVPPYPWLAALESSAPDLVELFEAFEAREFVRMRSELRRRACDGSAPGIDRELDVVAEALGTIVSSLPDEAFALPGGEADWTVAEALGHAIDARQQLTLSAALAARGRFPADAPPAVPSVPGSATATRAELLAGLEHSRRQVAWAARTVTGHETEECPLDHPQLGRLRNGEWLLFAGVHDLMHLDQLHGLDARDGNGAPGEPNSRPRDARK